MHLYFKKARRERRAHTNLLGTMHQSRVTEQALWRRVSYFPLQVPSLLEENPLLRVGISFARTKQAKTTKKKRRKPLQKKEKKKKKKRKEGKKRNGEENDLG